MLVYMRKGAATAVGMIRASTSPLPVLQLSHTVTLSHVTASLRRAVLILTPCMALLKKINTI